METRTFFDIDLANKFNCIDYMLSALEETELTLLIVGHNGFPTYYL